LQPLEIIEVAASMTKAGAGFGQALDHHGETGSVTADGERLVRGAQMHVEPVLRHIDPDEHRRAEERSMTCVCECGLTGRRPKRLFGFESWWRTGRRAQ
jgi:hypothetical protein